MITLDAASNSGVKAAVSNYTWNHTVGSLSNGILVVATGVRDGTATDLPVTGITFGGVALTKIRHDHFIVTNNIRTELWYLINPTASTAAVVVTHAGTMDTGCACAVSLAGVDQTRPIINSIGDVGNMDDVSLSMEIHVANAWLIDSMFSKIDAAITAAGSQVERADLEPNGGGDAWGCSTLADVSAGSNAMGWTWTGADDVAYSVAALRPDGGTLSGQIDLESVTTAKVNSNVLTLSVVVGSGSNRGLLVGVAQHDSNDLNHPVLTALYGLQSLTKVRSDNASLDVTTEWWELINPTTGTANLVVTTTGSVDISVFAFSLTGVNQTTMSEASNGSSTTSATPSVSVTSATNDAWLFTVLASQDRVVSSNHHYSLGFPLIDQSFENAMACIRPYKTAAAATSMAYDIAGSNEWAITGVSIKPVIVAAGGTAVKDPVGIGIIPFAR